MNLEQDQDQEELFIGSLTESPIRDLPVCDMPRCPEKSTRPRCFEPDYFRKCPLYSDRAYRTSILMGGDEEI